MVNRWIHFSCRVAFVAAILMPLVVSVGGCALGRLETWNPNTYRDSRAVDIDKRLDGAPPIVNNPF